MLHLFEWNDSKLHHWLGRTLLVVAEICISVFTLDPLRIRAFYKFSDVRTEKLRSLVKGSLNFHDIFCLKFPLMSFKGSCSWILQNNSLRGSIRAAWHRRIRCNALLVCVERLNFSELEIFILSKVTIHSASACRNWGLNFLLEIETVHKM